MQVVCEATQSSSLKIQVAALQNLVKILTLYYDYMEYYMGPALFAVRKCSNIWREIFLDDFFSDHNGCNEI